MDQKELEARMRAEAHAKLDEILAGKKDWRYPLVVTVSVEAPVVRKVIGELGKRPEE